MRGHPQRYQVGSAFLEVTCDVGTALCTVTFVMQLLLRLLLMLLMQSILDLRLTLRIERALTLGGGKVSAHV